MINGLSLYNFKNHKEAKFDFVFSNIISWKNWSWKTNILEAIYYLCNWHSLNQLKNNRLQNFSANNFLISMYENGDISEIIYKISYDLITDSTSFFIKNTKLIKSKYNSSSPRIAVFFSPLEMNIVYLWPSLRRDFLDEVCLLNDNSFVKIKSDYLKILKNRNKLLKDIKENKTQKSDIFFWNNALAVSAQKYYQFRYDFIDYIKDNIGFIEWLLENKYALEFRYISKADRLDIVNSIKSYLDSNIDRDIITWHTYIWPHLDDFSFFIMNWNLSYEASEFLSRWENKSILIWLKLLEIDYFKKNNSKDIVLLLDDIFAELDDEHISMVMKYSHLYQTFITTQNLPNSYLINADTWLINI